MLNANDINEKFKLPIFYNSQKIPVHQDIINDLEINKHNIKDENDSTKPANSITFLNSNDTNFFSSAISEQYSHYITSDTTFLKDSQKIISEIKPTQDTENYKNMIDLWNEFKDKENFLDKYDYLEYWNEEISHKLNNSPLFLQITGIYSLSSPVITLLTPLLLLIIPFLIIKMKGMEITIEMYSKILKEILKNNQMFSNIVNLNPKNANQVITAVISIVFYLFSIYNNINICIKFYKNYLQIHNYFSTLKNYLEFTKKRMDSYMEIIKNNNINSYSNFVLDINNHKTVLDSLLDRISNISPFTLLNIYKISELGTIRQLFYDISRNKILHNSILYSYGFNGYIDCLNNLQIHINNKIINKCQYNKKNIVKLEDNFYVSHINTNFITNNIHLKDKIIITGPNASGKTTILKSTLLNIIYSQQIGFGFYKKANICPYHFIHCYINIPDTSGRDSLFQAEARRCLEIINTIKENPKKRHFAIFDEIYSGTNPQEAAISASSFLEFLAKYPSFNCLLTTHYLDICKNLKNNKKIHNFKMECNYHNNHLIFKYKCIKGISNVKGGIDILEKMNYPSEILDKCKKYL